MKDRLHIGLAVIAIIAVGGFLRAFLPQADLPFDLTNSMSEIVDWPWYLNEPLARFGVINIDPSLEGYHPFFFHTYARLFFSLFGTSTTALTFFSLLPSLAIAILVAIALIKADRPQLAVWGLGLAALNFILVMFSRLPNIYIWIAGWGIFLGIIATSFKRLEYGVALAILLAALLSAALKPLCVFFIPCLGLAYLLTQERLPKKALGILGAGAALILLAAVFSRSFWATKFHLTGSAIQRYLNEFDSWDRTISNFSRFWFEQNTYLFSRLPLESVLAVIFSCALVHRWVTKKKRPAFLDAYCGALFFGGVGMGMILEYRPLRYFLFCIPAILYLATNGGQVVHQLLAKRLSRNALRTVGFFGALTIAFTALTPYLLWANHPTYSLREAREDTEEILPPQAALVGTFAHTLALRTPIQAFRYPPQSYGLKDFPLTPSHVAVDTQVNLPKIEKLFLDYPQWVLLEDFFIRGWEGHLYRLPDHETQAPPTLYEQGRLAVARHDTRAARALYQESMGLYPRSSAAARALLALALEAQETGPAFEALLGEALARNPSHPFTCMVALNHALARHDKARAIEYTQCVTQFAPRSKAYSELLNQTFSGQHR